MVGSILSVIGRSRRWLWRHGGLIARGLTTRLIRRREISIRWITVRNIGHIRWRILGRLILRFIAAYQSHREYQASNNRETSEHENTSLADRHVDCHFLTAGLIRY